MVAMEFVDDYSFIWSDLVAMWLIVNTLATLLAIQVMGGVMRLRVQCHGAVLLSECQSGPGLPVGICWSSRWWWVGRPLIGGCPTPTAHPGGKVDYPTVPPPRCSVVWTAGTTVPSPSCIGIEFTGPTGPTLTR